MKRTTQSKSTVRRSVVLPAELLEEVLSCSQSEPRRNVNRLVVTALEEFVARRRRLQFEQAMQEMAADPQIRKECENIGEFFRAAESDGLSIWDKE